MEHRLSAKRRHNLTHHLLPIAAAAALGGVAVHAFIPSVKSGVETLFNAPEKCGTATAKGGQDPVTVVHFAALDAEDKKPTGHRYMNETAAGDSVAQQWRAAHSNGPFLPGAEVEVYVQGDSVDRARLVPNGEAGCGGALTPTDISTAPLDSAR